MVLSLIQPDMATSNPVNALVIPVKTAGVSQSEFARVLQNTSNARTSAGTKAPIHPADSSTIKPAATTTEKNVVSTTANKGAPPQAASVSAVFANPAPILPDVALTAAATITSATTPAPMNSNLQQGSNPADDRTSEICDPARAATQGNLPASETRASQNPCILPPALPSDTKSADVSLQNAGPAANTDAVRVAAQVALSPAANMPLVTGIDSAQSAEVPAEPDSSSVAVPSTLKLLEVSGAISPTVAGNKSSADPSAQFVMSPHERNPAINGVENHPLPMVTPQPESQPFGLKLRSNLQPAEAPKPAYSAQDLKLNSSHSLPTTAPSDRTHAVDNAPQGVQNVQVNSSEYQLAKTKGSTNAPSDFSTPTSSPDAGPTPGPTPTSSNDPSTASVTITNVLSQVSAVGNQQAAGPSLVPPGKTQSPLSPANSSEPTVPFANTVPVARIVETMGQSEMHIGLRTEDFGSVEVHTVVRDMQVGLAVGSEKGDLRAFLTWEIPGLQASLRQQDLLFDHIRFLEPGGASAGFSGGDDSQSRSSSQGHSSASGLPGFAAEQANSAQPEMTLDERIGLNVHA